MKLLHDVDLTYGPAVVPLVGTWIEITVFGLLFCPLLVVPLVGTWIEIKCDIITAMAWLVVPLVGTWIEISMYVNWKNPLTGRSPCGNVD